jgi:hypothetical protein
MVARHGDQLQRLPRLRQAREERTARKLADDRALGGR